MRKLLIKKRRGRVRTMRPLCCVCHLTVGRLECAGLCDIFRIHEKEVALNGNIDHLRIIVTTEWSRFRRVDAKTSDGKKAASIVHVYSFHFGLRSRRALLAEYNCLQRARGEKKALHEALTGEQSTIVLFRTKIECQFYSCVWDNAWD